MENFGKNFVFGAATAAYQIEGGYNEGGRSLSIWDTFSHTPGKIKDGSNGDIACDHFHKVDEDIQLMKSLGLKAYRFSISWSRLLPDGFNINNEGLDFYNYLINKLIENGIEPYMTMYHWDLPQCLQDLNGWTNPDSISWFDNYSKKIVECFGDRVKHMITFNEPSIFTKKGYQDGDYAPGWKCDNDTLVKIVHHILLSHGKAVKNIREKYSDIKVGITLANSPMVPLTSSPEDIEQAQLSQDYTGDCGEFFLYEMRIWGDPIFYGKYPDGYYKRFKDSFTINDGDMELISQKLDFLGLNTYSGTYVYRDNWNPKFIYRKQGESINSLGWTSIPESLYYVTKYFYEAYHCPIYITENGYSGNDIVSLDGQVHDPQRIDFYERYLSELKKAVNEGIDIRGYFTWSLIDNFEWDHGYDPRFGLVYINYLDNCKRIPKDSFYWYRDLIQSQF